MSNKTLTEQIILDEIAGKNKAIHAYDNVLWTIRSGFLTLFFVGWGIILRGFLGQSSSIVAASVIVPVIVPMFFISLGLSVGGFIIDVNYVKRKFRVISVLNKLLSIVLTYSNIEEMSTAEHKHGTDLTDLVRVSGDSGDESYKITGFSNALTVSVAIYTAPLLFLIVGLISTAVVIYFGCGQYLF